MKRLGIVLVLLLTGSAWAVTQVVPHRLRVEGSRLWDFSIGDRLPQTRDTLRVTLTGGSTWTGILVRQVVDTTPAPPAPLPATRIAIVGTPRVPGGNDYSIDVAVLDSAGGGRPAVAVTMTVSGGAFGPGTRLETRNTDAGGVARINWAGMATGDSLVATALGARAKFVHGATQPPPPPPPPPIDTTTVPPPATGNRTPANLLPVLGPLVARDTLLRTYDARYQQTERARFREWQANPGQLTVGFAMHYGSLRGRLSWAIRNGEPFGASVPQGDTSTAYGRGRLPVQWYLTQYSKPNNFAVQPHNNTALADVEALLALESDSLARLHIHCSAALGLYDPYGYIKLTHQNGDARWAAVTLQAMNAATRFGIPYSGCPRNQNFGANPAYSSWRQAGDTIIAWLETYGGVTADGKVESRANGTGETYFMSALVAVQLLGWDRAAPHPKAKALAQRIMTHLMLADDSARARGMATLPYLGGQANPAPDLAAYYVWPALVMWQETGDARFHAFALRQLAATLGAFIQGLKQWNQTYSTLGPGAEALLKGVRWR